jgi:hypothetical protein
MLRARCRHIIRNALSVGLLLAGARTEKRIGASGYECLAAANAGQATPGFAAHGAAMGSARF